MPGPHTTLACPHLTTARDARSDLSYNEITSLGGEQPFFTQQANLVDLLLSHNSIRDIPARAFLGLKTLQVLDLENNGIERIHSEAFTTVKELRDL